ncbi:hypothetical protein BDQ17DRAFT_1373476, partial [Cyathus striatus]
MKLLHLLPFAALISIANSSVLRQRAAAASECSLVECIVSLAELPLQITTYSDPIKLATQAADCIAEASLAAVELPSHCSGCTKV